MSHNTQTARERLKELWDMEGDWTAEEEAEYHRLAPIVAAQNKERMKERGWGD